MYKLDLALLLMVWSDSLTSTLYLMVLQRCQWTSWRSWARCGQRSTRWPTSSARWTRMMLVWPGSRTTRHWPPATSTSWSRTVAATHSSSRTLIKVMLLSTLLSSVTGRAQPDYTWMVSLLTLSDVGRFVPQHAQKSCWCWLFCFSLFFSRICLFFSYIFILILDWFEICRFLECNLVLLFVVFFFFICFCRCFWHRTFVFSRKTVIHWIWTEKKNMKTTHYSAEITPFFF